MRKEKEKFKAQLEEKNGEIEALKTELEKAHSSPPDKTTIKEACDMQMEEEVVQLKATGGHLSNDLTNARTTIESVTKILNKDLQKKVDRMEKEIMLLIAERTMSE
jgi:hypothetical protein